MEIVWLFVVIVLSVVGVAVAYKLLTSYGYVNARANVTPATLDTATQKQLVEKASEWWRVANDQHSVIEHILSEDSNGVYVISDANRIAAGKVIDRFNHATQGGK